MSEITKENATDLFYGHCLAGPTAKRLSEQSTPVLKGVLIRAAGIVDPTPNTACVWVGDARVLPSSDVERGGMPIPPGESLFIPIDDPYRLWVISTGADQDVAWMAM
jgi:hypothetical protein